MPCFANYIKGSIDESDIASEPSDHPHVAGVKLMGLAVGHTRTVEAKLAT